MEKVHFFSLSAMCVVFVMHIVALSTRGWGTEKFTLTSRDFYYSLDYESYLGVSLFHVDSTEKSDSGKDTTDKTYSYSDSQCTVSKECKMDRKAGQITLAFGLIALIGIITSAILLGLVLKGKDHLSVFCIISCIVTALFLLITCILHPAAKATTSDMRDFAVDGRHLQGDYDLEVTVQVGGSWIVCFLETLICLVVSVMMHKVSHKEDDYENV